MDVPKNPIFIIGTQRSGTTLLCRMLSAHPEVFIQNELNLKSIFEPHLNKDEIIQRLHERIADYHGIDLGTLLSHEKKLYWGLKDPQLTFYLSILGNFIPESKFLLIVRDARAVVNSYIENKWGLATNAYSGAIRWRDEVATQLQFMDKYPRNVHLVRFEDLVEAPEDALAKVTEFLGIDFHDDMLKYNDQPAFYYKTRENVQTSKQPNKKIANKWESTLSPRQIQIVEMLAGRLMRKLAYYRVTEDARIGRLETAFYKIHQQILGEIQLQYRWRISKLKLKKRKREYQERLLANLDRGSE